MINSIQTPGPKDLQQQICFFPRGNNEERQRTLMLKSDLFWDILYMAGKRIIVSALQHRSKRPNAIGGAAVNKTL